MPPVVSPSEFLATIWGDSQGYAELTAISKTGVKSFPWNYPGSIEPFLAAAANHNKDSNVYMGVCLRREKWPRPSGRNGVDGKPIIEYRGTEANAHSTWVVWVEFDFISTDGQGHKGRVVDPAMARKWLADFALKPSIIIKSGGGIQVYWLLKEAAMGDDLWKVKAINKALVEFFTIEIDGKKFGADTASVDLARILRVPGTQNVKYNPPRPCEVSWWRPDFRYTLDDFEIIPIGNLDKPALTQVSEGPAAQHQSPAASARALPSKALDQTALDGCIENLEALWVSGHKHDMAMLFAGMCAHSGVCLESAQAVVQAVSDKTGSDTPKRLKDVLDTYNNFVGGKDVKGKTAFQKLIEDILPKDAKEKGLARIKAISKKLPKPPPPPANAGDGGEGENQNGMGQEPDFEIVKMVKHDSRPAQWEVTIGVPEEGEPEVSVTVETDKLMSFTKFQDAFYESTHYMLTPITQRRWKTILGAFRPFIEVKEMPREARPEGAVESALEDFLGEAKENAEPGMLRTFPGYDESSRFFRFEAFKDYLREHAIKVEDRTVFRHIKGMGLNSGAKRFGPKVLRVWIQPLDGGNGPQNGNGHPPGPEKPPKADSPVNGHPKKPDEVELFPMETGTSAPPPGPSGNGAKAHEDLEDGSQDFGNE